MTLTGDSSSDFNHACWASSRPRLGIIERALSLFASQAIQISLNPDAAARLLQINNYQLPLN